MSRRTRPDTGARRSAGGGSNRAARVAIAKETLDILDKKSYVYDNINGEQDTVDLSKAITKSVQGAKCYRLVAFYAK